MFNKIKKVIFNKKKKSMVDEYNEYDEIEYIELPEGEIVYSQSSKILIVSKKKFIWDNDDIEWFRGIITLEKVKKYLENTQINKGDLVEVSYKESNLNGEVIKREIQKIKKLEGFSYNIKTQTSKVKKVYDLGFAKKGIEFENGHTYSEVRHLHIDPCPTEQEKKNIYTNIFIHKDDLCNETYLEICKGDVNTGKTITIDADKIRNDVTYTSTNKIQKNSYEYVQSLLEDTQVINNFKTLDS